MAGVLSKQKYLSKEYDNEAVFTADTNMYISHNYAELRGMYYHIANESATSDLMRIKLFSMGVIPGVPDFRFELPRPGWYLELKVGKSGRLSPKQQQLHERWRRHGIIIHTAWTPGEVCKILESMFGVPTFAV